MAVAKYGRNGKKLVGYVMALCLSLDYSFTGNWVQSE